MQRKMKLARTLMMLLAVLTTMSVWATNVDYYDPTAATGSQVKSADATAIASTTTVFGADGTETWYYVTGDVTISNRVNVKGTVNLILADGCTLTVSGIRLVEGNTLKIYAQKAGEGCGKLISNDNSSNAAIGGNGGNDGVDKDSPNGAAGESAGTLTIYGGDIQVNGNIGGGQGGNRYSENHGGITYVYGNSGNGGYGGTITIYGGIVKTGDYSIGGGHGGSQAHNGSANINLSWTNLTDRIQVDEYYGTVTLLKDFADANIPDWGISKGVESVYNVNGRTLMPSVIAIEAKEPTCTEKGYTQNCWYNIVDGYYYLDFACTQLITKSVEIPMKHQLKYHEAVPATFSADGTLDYWQCSKCGKYFRDEDNEYELDSYELIAEQGQGNATDGYYVLMPKYNKKVLSLDNTITSFKIYDDGGESYDYSNDCDGYLALTAPEDKLLQLTGNLMTETDCDYLTVYAGTTDKGDVLLNLKSSDTDDNDEPVPTSIGTLINKSMLLYFHSDGSSYYGGLDLTVTFVDDKESNINIAEAEHGKIKASVAKAKAGKKITLTATPDESYYLTGVTVTYKDGENDVKVDVDLNQWCEEENNTATFIMPYADVTVTPIFSNSNLFVNMPKTGTITGTFPEGVTSFKIYDNGGETGNYSNDCDGYLALTAPEGKLLQLTGNLMTEADYDYLTVYAGTTKKGPVLLDQKWSDADDNDEPVPTSIGTLTSKSMLLYFYSDGNTYYDGLDLEVALVDANNNPLNITINNAANGSLAIPSSAKWGDAVTLTATPNDGYLLESLTVTYKNGADNVNVDVRGGHWYDGCLNVASFVMPNVPVTVTPTFAQTDKLYINMPTNGKVNVEIPTCVTSFKVYDDGGEDGNYSEDCEGTLWLYAPNGYYIDFQGTVWTAPYNEYDDRNDQVSVGDYDGTQNFYSETDETVSIALDSDKKDRDWIEIHFVSNDDDQTNQGLNMTINIAAKPIDGEDNGNIIADDDITVPSLDYTRTFDAPEAGDTPDATIDGEAVYVYTTCLPTTPTTGEGIKYYTLSGSTNSSLQFTQVNDADVAAETPYLVTVSENAVNGDFPVSSTGTNVTLKKKINGTVAGGYQFVGTTLGLTNQEAAEAGAYILQDGNVWKQVTTENTKGYIPAFRAFIVAVSGGAPLRIGTEFGDDDTTGIQSIQLIDNDGTEQWFDLSGRRIEKPTTKGIYIYNGRKVAIQ